VPNRNFIAKHRYWKVPVFKYKGDAHAGCMRSNRFCKDEGVMGYVALEWKDRKIHMVPK
jgi:hypothetical protein